MRPRACRGCIFARNARCEAPVPTWARMAWQGEFPAASFRDLRKLAEAGRFSECDCRQPKRPLDGRIFAIGRKDET